MRRGIWFISFIIAVVLVVVLFHGALSDYFQYKTYIVTEIKDDIKSLPLPTITICNHNYFYPFKYINFPFNISLGELGRIFQVIRGTPPQFSDSKLFKKLNMTSYEDLVQLVEFNNEKTRDNNVTRIFNHHKICIYNSDTECTKDDFKYAWFWHGKYLCQQFNGYDPTRPPRRQHLISSPFRVYFNILASGKKSGHFDLYIHEYGTPHHVYEIEKKLLVERGRVYPGNLGQVKLDARKVRCIRTYIHA